MKSFLIKSTVLTFTVLAIGILVYSNWLRQYYLPVLPAFLFFFYFVTNLVHAYLLHISVKSNAGFTSRYMAASFLKMFFYLATAIVYIALNKENAKLFLVNYLILYLVYTIYEVLEISKVVRRVNQ